MNTAVQGVSIVLKIKGDELHNKQTECKTPRKKAEAQSVDYAITHVGKKYPSLCPSTVYRPS
jgi:hypothetical protein